MAGTPFTAGAARSWALALALVLLALVPASVAAGSTSCAGATASVSTDSTSRDVVRLRSAIRCLFAKERSKRNLHALQDRRALRVAAESHSRDMVRRNYFDHVSPSGSRVETRARRAGYLRRVRRWDLGEALGWGTLEQGSPESLITRMLESPKHRALLLDRSFRDVGIGVALGAPVEEGGEPGVTLTLAFGHVVRQRVASRHAGRGKTGRRKARRGRRR